MTGRDHILEALRRTRRSRRWLANHPDNPVGSARTFQYLRGEHGTSDVTFLTWLDIVGGAVRQPRARR